MAYEKQQKRIIFFDDEHRHAKLKVKLKHDGMTQSDFFRALLTGYLENNSLILDYMDQHRIANKIQSKDKIKKSRKEIEEGKEAAKQLIFDENEIDNLFDIIEKEYPEL
tara:strand:- start:1005 stop:1331 length:327 start_codon:yes stop_codon:yes gene_type:complete